MRVPVVRALRFVVAAALLAGVLILAQRESATVTALALAGLGVAGLAWWWWRRPEVAGTVASLAVTCLLTSQLTYQVGVRMELVFTLELGLAFWLFAAVVAVLVWLAPRHPGSRAVTVVLGHGVLVVAAALSVLSTAVVPVAGLVGALLVVAWRSRPRRWPPRRPRRAVRLDTAARARGEGRTREVLSALDDEWSRDGDVLSGPPGMFLVRSRSWSGRIALVDLDGDQAYGWNGDPAALGARLEPIVVDVERFVTRHGFPGGDVAGLVVFWGDTELPEGGVEMAVLDMTHRRREGTRLVLLRGEELLAWLGKRTTIPRPGRE